MKTNIEQAISAATTPEPSVNGHAKHPPTIQSDKAPQNLKDVGLIRALADAITSENHFAQDVGGKVYVFRRGVYADRGEPEIKRAVKRLCNKWGISAKWSPRLACDVAEYIRVDSRKLWDKPPLDFINVENGLLGVADMVLLPHSPEHLSPVQLPITYDPDATCPRTERFYGEVLPPDTVEVAFEVVAWLMLPHTSIQQAVLMLGEGSNGKSTMLRQWERFLGKSNVSALSLHKLEGDKFSVARLVGKLANICPDLPSAHLESTSVFKALTGFDTVTGERKFQESFDFVSYARLVFSANHPPRSKDASHAFFRRWYPFPFGRTFGADAIPREVLDAELSSPQELSGLLNKALAALPRLARGHFTETASVKQAWEEFRATTDPLAVWLDHNTIDDPSSVWVEKGRLISIFNKAATQKGVPAMTNTAFGLALKRLRPKVTEAQRTTSAGVKWAYIGIGLADEPTTEGG